MDSSGLLFQPSVNTNPRVQKTEAAARTHKILRSYYPHQSHSSSWAPPLWKHKGGSSAGGEQQSAELCQASAQSPCLAAGGGGGSLQGPAQDTGARQSWQRRGPELAWCWGRKEPRARRGTGFRALQWMAGGAQAWLYSAVGLSAPPEPPERAGQAGPPHSELATVTDCILATEQCRRDLPAQSQGFPLSLAARCHLTWNLVQELVGGARQDPDPIQLGHQVGVLIQDKSALPAKASQEESGSGCSPTLPRASPAPAMPWNDRPETPSP